MPDTGAKKRQRVAVALSGGVDSSVAALLLMREGYEVFGVTMDIWRDEQGNFPLGDNTHPEASPIHDAARAAGELGISCNFFYAGDIFKKTVADYFVAEYLRGRTPNPCTACNPAVKFGALLEFAIKLGADYFATGHYAQIIALENGRLALKAPPGNPKDQTYMLYGLSQEQLARVLMPCGAYTKDEIRWIAQENGFSSADKPDSQEICFIPDNDYAGFIKKTGFVTEPGSFVDIDGNVIGTHKGAMFYTVGQRKGLGEWFGKPVYVRRIDPAKNEIELSDDKDLFCAELTAKNVNFMGASEANGVFSGRGKIRHAHKPADCEASYQDGLLTVRFAAPQRAITPGQAIVIYDFDGVLLCGGIIEEARYAK